MLSARLMIGCFATPLVAVLQGSLADVLPAVGAPCLPWVAVLAPAATRCTMLAACVLALQVGDCMCLGLHVERPEAAIADPSRLVIKAIQVSCAPGCNGTAVCAAET